MSCGQDRSLHGYLDGELDAVRAAEFEAHLPSCHACTQAVAAQQSLRRQLADADLYAKAPAALRESVRAQLASPEAGTARAFGWRSLAAAAGLVVVAFGLGRNLPTSQRGDNDGELTRQVLDAHARSLQAAHLTDVASSDRHTVKPWFAGKLSFAPAVPDLASDGFPLVGGRLEVIGGRSVAALVYERRQHTINVFVWPSEKPEAAHEAGAERGYAWIRWTRAGMCFWVVSDLAAPELDEFARRLSS
jgi:anti-sigma factor RsiW